MSGVWDPLRPELDTWPPRDPRLAVTSYVVCSTPRSGSGLLCRGLAATCMAGAPAEYFNPNQRRPLSARWQTGTDLHAYVRELRARRTSPAGILGVKLHWDQLEHLRGEVMRLSAREIELHRSTELLDELFPGSTYVHVRRADVDRQAISLWTALHTGVWSARMSAAADPLCHVPYSFKGISRQRASILYGEKLWARAFARTGIQPVVVLYEEFVAAYERTIASVLERAAGQSLDVTEVAQPDSRRQGDDARSEELLALFKRDAERFPEGRPTRIPDLTNAVRRKFVRIRSRRRALEPGRSAA